MSNLSDDDFEQFHDFIQRASETMGELFEGLLKIVMELYDMVYAEYTKRGAPYGETPEGFTRWLQDMSEIARLEMEIYQIKQRQDLMTMATKQKE